MTHSTSRGASKWRQNLPSLYCIAIQIGRLSFYMPLVALGLYLWTVYKSV